MKERRLSKKNLEIAENYGGSDIDEWLEYQRPSEPPSCDKGGHRQRSIFHDPSHLRHWRKKIDS